MHLNQLSKEKNYEGFIITPALPVKFKFSWLYWFTNTNYKYKYKSLWLWYECKNISNFINVVTLIKFTFACVSELLFIACGWVGSCRTLCTPDRPCIAGCWTKIKNLLFCAIHKFVRIDDLNQSLWQFKSLVFLINKNEEPCWWQYDTYYQFFVIPNLICGLIGLRTWI